MHREQRLRLHVFGQADAPQGLLDGGLGRDGEELDAHDAAGAGGVEAEQGHHLGPDAGRQEVEHLDPPVLGQLGDGVGGVVGPHVGDDLGHLLVGHVVEEPVGDVGIELLEDVRFELGIAVHDVEDLLALLAGRRPRAGRRSGPA